MIQELRQPENSNLCGQTCVAMIASIPLEASIQVFGTRGRTRTRQLISALRALGISCGDRLVPIAPNKPLCLPDTCIVKLKIDWRPKPHTHWTLWHQGRFYDPSEFLQTFLSYDGQYHQKHGLRPLSYLEVNLEGDSPKEDDRSIPMTK